MRYKCHKISEGIAEAEALISSDDMCFYLADPKTGKIIEDSHSLYGTSISKKILIFPSGKGSSVVQADGLFQLNKENNMPLAMIIQYPETVLVSSAIIMDIPMVDRVEQTFYEEVKNGDKLIVNANEGYVEIVR